MFSFAENSNQTVPESIDATRECDKNENCYGSTNNPEKAKSESKKAQFSEREGTEDSCGK